MSKTRQKFEVSIIRVWLKGLINHYQNDCLGSYFQAIINTLMLCVNGRREIVDRFIDLTQVILFLVVLCIELLKC